MKQTRLKSWSSVVTSLFIFGGCVSVKGPAALEVPADSASFSQASSSGRASYSQTEREGLKLVELTTKDADGKELLALTVAPEAGSNIVSIRYRGIEVLEQPKSFADVHKQDAGIEFLYPTPNRIKNGKLEYKDLKLSFEPNLGAHFIHGLAREYPWSSKTPEIMGDSVVYQTWLIVDEKSPFYRRFPIKNSIMMVISLEGEKVEFTFHVENLDQRSLPFGLAVHPYFKLHGKRSDSSVQLRVANQMEAPDLIPTGKLIPLKKTKYARLPKGMSIEKVLGADTVFWPTTGSAMVREPEIQFEIATSKDFGHTVLWAPKKRELFAVENQTSSTDAHNLAHRGRVKESGLIDLEPGAKWKGWVSYHFSPIAKSSKN